MSRGTRGHRVATLEEPGAKGNMSTNTRDQPHSREMEDALVGVFPVTTDRVEGRRRSPAVAM